MSTSETIAASFAALRKSHPAVPALEVLDLVMQGAAVLVISADQLHPRSPLGQVIAEVFDGGMSPGDWFAWTGPQADALARDTLLTIWRTYVLPRLVGRYGVRLK